jgi:hypothetical protein
MNNEEMTADEKKVLSLYRTLRANGSGDLRVFVKDGAIDETHIRTIDSGGEDLALKGVRKLKETIKDNKLDETI